jgi:polyhydroxyalkanoate synthase subunit PhaE
MKTNNPVIDTLVESQTQFINNWMDSAKKMQSAFTSGTLASEGQTLYKEYFDKQMSILNDMKESSANVFGNNENNPQEFFKKWFNQQANYAKQMADFTQSLQSSFSNFGKPAQDYMNNFSQSNTAFTDIYNSWLNTLNTSFDTMSRNMNGGFNKDVFSNFMQGSQVYAKMQEFFQPMANAMQKGQFNLDAFKTHFTPESYNNLAKQMFGSFFNDAPVKDLYDNSIKKLHDFFTSQNNLSKEYFAQVQNITHNFPKLFSTNVPSSMKDFYSQMQNIFSRTFEPLMKIANPGREKENAESVIALMDRMAEYTIKQAELQALLQATAKKGVEKIAQKYAEKFSDPKAITEVPSAQEMYSEWVKVNEELFTELFSSEEFSKVKGETLNLTNDVKKHFEKQFETSFRNFPIVFKSEVEEMQKTIYDLKKQVKELQSKLAMQPLAEVESSDEEKAPKKVKK